MLDRSCQRCLWYALLVLDSLWVVLQESYYRTLLELSRCNDFVGRCTMLAPLDVSHTERTRCNHRLDEVPHIAQHNTEAQNWVCIARLGLHGLDLHAL
jgi:hypothetical protein